MLNPLDVEVHLATHAELIWNVDRHAWMRAPARRRHRLWRTRDRIAYALFALAARVDPEAVPARLRSEAPPGRL